MMEPGPIYWEDKLTGIDPYDVFLGGPQALIRIENSDNPNGRDLLLFRDSFSSSIGPLLALGYRSVTLVDLRYFALAQLTSYVPLAAISQSDILYLYSLQIINNAEVQLVNLG
jgi:hypothetical protein